MSEQEKIAKLEEIMELDEGELKKTDVLNDFDEWDSIAVLSYIAILDSEFGKTIKGSEVKAFVTVQDAIERME
jgi:acyl carrier protein